MTNHCNKEVILTLFILFIHTPYAAVDSDFLTYYDLKVQRNEATCRLVNHANLPSDRLTLAGRDCMCDEECVEYKDCCKDSRYYRPNEQSYPSPYHCSETTAVYMKTICASTWDSDELTQHCANSIQPLRSEDFHLILPVVNQRTRITYGNRYCAMCNHDQDESNWLQFPLDVSCGLAPPGFLKKPPAPETPPPSYHYNKQAEYNRPIFNEKISEFDSSENERCNNNTSKVINNIFHQPSPGFILDINLYIANDSSIGILNGKNALRLPFQLQNVISSDFRDGNNFLRRRKRQHDHIDFEKYSHLAEKICATAKYDSYNDEFVSHYQNKYYICRYRALLPENAENYTRTCVPFVQNKCPDGFKNEIIKEECAIHTKIVYNKQTKKPYRNKDCARCNGEKEESLDGKPQLTRNVDTDSKKKDSMGTNKGMHAGFDGKP